MDSQNVYEYTVKSQILGSQNVCKYTVKAQILGEKKEAGAKRRRTFGALG